MRLMRQDDRPASTDSSARLLVRVPMENFEMRKARLEELYNQFSDRIFERLEDGAEEYGDRSFERPASELIDEIEQELFDVCGWSFVLWTKIVALKTAMELEADRTELEADRPQFVEEIPAPGYRGGLSFVD